MSRSASYRLHWHIAWRHLRVGERPPAWVRSVLGIAVYLVVVGLGLVLFAQFGLAPEPLLDNTVTATVRDAGGTTVVAPGVDNEAFAIASELALVELGPIHMLTIPGELLPELAIGGYDGSRINAPGVPLIEDGNVNPPDVSKAPEGPYIKERMQSTYPWLIGLANDELGYIIPQYNFELAASNPWVEEAEGDHYEETNSLGPDMAMFIDKYADLLIYWAAKR